MTELVENILIGIRKWVNSKIPSQIVTGVKSGDTVLSLSGTEVQSTISVAIEKKTVGQAQVDHIVLKGIGGAEIASVDASAFVKDGMIDSVAWSQESGKENVLVITWNTESGKQSTEIDFARFIDDYVEGDGISVSGSVISIKIDPTPGNVTLSATSTGLKANVDLSGYSVTGHTHALGDVSGLTEALSGKSNTGHTHQINEVSGLTEALDEFSEVVSSHITEIEDALEGKSDTGHTHQVSDVNGLSEALSGKANASHSHAIGDVSGLTEALSGKANASHSHAISDVSGLTEALSGKANASHSHAVSDVSGLTEALDEFSEVVASHITEIEDTLEGKSDTGHTHQMSDVNGLTDALAGKSDTGHTHSEYSLTSHTHSEYSQTGHTHQVSEVSGLTEALDEFSEVVASHITEIEDTLEGKSDTGHTHQVSEVNGLSDALSGKADASHSHAISDVSGLTEALSGKSNAGHTHQVSEVNGLADALSGKADASHSHAIGDVSGLTETLEDFSEVISSHINEIEENINGIEDALEEISFEELEYDEYALYTQESENIIARGMVSKVGKTVTMQIYNANTKDGWGEICYRLPYAPDSTYVPVVNSRGMYESNGIHYKVSIEDRTVEVEPEVYVTYPALILVHYVNGSPANWEYGQNVIFKVDYITTE